jgi:hypothetical protein
MVLETGSLDTRTASDDDNALPQQVLPSGFDGLQYIASHGDLVQALGVDLVAGERHLVAGERHYLAFGFDEGRATDTFNEVGYLERYPDVRMWVGDDADAATRHYIAFGFDQGRTPPLPGLPEGFDGLQYIASQRDLITMLGADGAAGEQHYVSVGRGEGRAVDDFDEAQYLANYEDLQDAFGEDTAAATAHYIEFGFGREGRTDEPLEPGNTAPAADDTGAATEGGGPVTLDVLANDTDPLTVVSVDDTDTVGTVMVSEDGANVVYDPGDAFPELGSLEITEDTFTYTMRDAAGEEATATVVVTVTGAVEATSDFLF